MQVSGFTPRASNQNPPNCAGSVAVTLAVQTITIPGAPFVSETVARFVTVGTADIAWAYGNQAGLTIANGCHMLGNTVEIFLIPANVTQICAIGSATGTTLYVIPGDGL